MEYKILESDRLDHQPKQRGHAEGLQQKVENAIKQGWEPLGGVSVAVDSVRSPSTMGSTSTSTIFIQAMTLTLTSRKQSMGPE